MSYFGFGWKQRKWSEEMEINWCIVCPEKWNVLMKNVTLFLSRVAQQVSSCNCSRALIARGTKVPLSSEKRNNLLLSEKAEASDSSKGNVKFRRCIYQKRPAFMTQAKKVKYSFPLSRSKKKKIWWVTSVQLLTSAYQTHNPFSHVGM